MAWQEPLLTEFGVYEDDWKQLFVLLKNIKAHFWWTKALFRSLTVSIPKGSTAPQIFFEKVGIKLKRSSVKNVESLLRFFRGVGNDFNSSVAPCVWWLPWLSQVVVSRLWCCSWRWLWGVADTTGTHHTRSWHDHITLHTLVPTCNI